MKCDLAVSRCPSPPASDDIGAGGREGAIDAAALRPFQCRINADRGPWQLFARAPLLTRDKDLSQPATRVDTTCWQLFRPDINTAHFYFFVAEVMSNYLTTDVR